MSSSELFHWLKEEESSTGGELWELSHRIWSNPELNFKEHVAHDSLTDFLESKGFKVKRSHLLDTAFRAEMDLGDSTSGPTVAFLCEYDALPVIGHGCGHNLIAEVGVAAALAVSHIAKSQRSGKTVSGKLVVLGTPAEEGGGGKIIMAEKGAFQDIDVALMAHPRGASHHGTPKGLTSLEVDIRFKGRASHAAARPWEGLNALDAAVSCYVNVALLKQQLRPGWKINGIFTRGGDAFNVIPHETEMSFLLRTPESKDVDELLTKFQKCVTAAAEATGCQGECVTKWEVFYKDIVQNEALADRYGSHAEELGVEFLKGYPMNASTDFGNVSYLVAGLHPTFGINSSFNPHEAGFTASAGSREAQDPVLKAAAALAATAVDVMTDPQLMQAVKKFHGKTMVEMKPTGENCN